MKLNPFQKNKDDANLQEKWATQGEIYASSINEMLDFADEHGWEKWTKKEPEDPRDGLADQVIALLRTANAEDSVETFRNQFPPAHSPFINYFENKGQTIEQIHFIENEKIVFLTGTSYQQRQAYILDGDNVMELDASIDAIGKSKQGNVFAIQNGNKITTTQGWQGDIIAEFTIKKNEGEGITQLIPFNDGQKVLSVTSEGIYLMDQQQEKLVHPVPDEEEMADWEAQEEWTPDIDMGNANLSHDNQYIIVGDQCSDHRILDAAGNQIGGIGPQSSYPHFCMFSRDDKQVITNSCHFYGGITIGVDAKKLNGIEIEAYEESPLFHIVEEGMRVYCGQAYDDFYILGDAFGYVRAMDKTGKPKWRHFVGSTIGGIAISDDGKTLWVASCTGMIHKLRLGQGHRDTHTIGNGNHYEEFRLILWKGEPIMRW